MKIRTVIFSAIFLLPLPMLADNTTFIYTGNNFTDVEAPYTTSDKVTGSFILPTPGDNLVGAPIDADAFDFTDGIHTFEGQYAHIGNIWTDATGALDGWVIFLGGNGAPGCVIEGGSAATAPQGGDQCELNLGGPVGENSNAGTWTSVITTTPEPPSFILMSTALLVSAFVVRKRVQHSSVH